MALVLSLRGEVAKRGCTLLATARVIGLFFQDHDRESVQAFDSAR